MVGIDIISQYIITIIFDKNIATDPKYGSKKTTGVDTQNDNHTKSSNPRFAIPKSIIMYIIVIV